MVSSPSAGLRTIRLASVLDGIAPSDRAGRPSSVLGDPGVGRRAPALHGNVLTGGTFDISQLRGPFVVVDFFSSWCVPCRTEQPQLVKSAEDQRYGADLVGVIFEDTVPYIRALLGPWVGLYPVITDPGGQGSLNCGVDNPPSKYVIDPNGTVVAKIIGPVTATGLDSIIARARSERL
jgi:cytochrome c biogenesis protein CcmG/thiol:disulfide interchange protein DsbE